MRALILAAGRGSRMSELTEASPKCLTKLSGKALIEYQLAALKIAGIAEIAIVTGYKSDLLAAYGDAQFHNANWATSNMVLSLMGASEWFSKSPCIISYSDIVYNASDVATLINGTGDISIAYDPHWLELWSARFSDPLSDAETFSMSSDGFLTEIGAKSSSIADIHGQYVGLIKTTPSGFRTMKDYFDSHSELANKMDMTSMLRALVKNRIKIGCTPIKESWGEVDSPSDLALYEKLIKEGRMRLGLRR